jgi:hypothetical protein
MFTDSSYHVVTAATGSPLLGGPVTVEALWASVPELAETVFPDSNRPRPLLYSPRQSLARRCTPRSL